MTVHAIDLPEILVRGAAGGCYVLLSLAIFAGGRTPARVFASLFCLAAVAHTLTQSHTIFAALGVVAVPVWILSAVAAGLFWAFALELFGDSKRLTPARFLPAALLLAIALTASSLPALARPLWLLHNLLGAILMLNVLIVVWTGWRGDLVEARRRLRGPLLGVAALYALAVVGVQSVELFRGPAGGLSMVAAFDLLVMSLAGGVVFLRADSQLLGAASDRKPAPKAEPQDQALLARLMAAIDGDELWREEGLTISALATRLGAAEHHLRRLINEGLGYRNFAAFINERRITAAKRILADASQSRTSIATIAFDTGFGSLGPFNRAFRDETGQTPRDWRRAALAG